MTTQGETRNPEEAGGLRRELRFWEAIALSIAIMAPTAAMALNGTVPAQLVGRAVPLAFIFATVGVIFVSYAFIRLSGYFSHAGSVYAFSGVTLGPRAGFFSGWALLGTYLAFTAASTAEAGLFGVGVLPGLGDLGRRRVAGHRARGRRPDRVLRLRRHPRGHAVAARPGGDLGAAHRDPRDHHLRQAARGQRPAGPGLHGRHLQAPFGHVAGHGGHRRGLRLPLLRGLRGRRLAGRGDRRPDSATSRARSSPPCSSRAPSTSS